MPRRNAVLLLAIAVAAAACHLRVDRYGRHLAYAMRQIDQRYFEPVEERELFEGAVEGMVHRLDQRFDDRHSVYISAAELPEFEEDLKQEFGGVGIEIVLSQDTRQLTVLSPLYGSPAYEAGIRAGDRVLAIDGHSTQGLSLQDAQQRVRGPLGTSVVLTVLHEGEDKPVDVAVVRATIQVDTVLGDRRNADGSWNFFLEGHDRIGYLQITFFTDKTADEVRRALEWLAEHDLRGLVLDLRGNPGGFLDSAVDVCDMFIDSGVIVTTRGRQGRLFREFNATAPGTFDGFPVAVLVNRGSASASEIVAGCLQDHGRAVVVGQRTYGKGTVQELIDLQSGYGMLKLTTAQYQRPSGRNINRAKKDEKDPDWGVHPDPGFEVTITPEEWDKLLQARRRRDAIRPSENPEAPTKQEDDPVDPQLNKAVECVEKAAAGR